MFGTLVRKDLRYSPQSLIQPCTPYGDSMTKGGKLSKPENSASERSLRLMWVETWKMGAIIQRTTTIYNISKFQADT